MAAENHIADDRKKVRLIDANVLCDLLDVEYKRKMKLVRKCGTHLDTLAEGIMSMSVLLGTMPTVDAVEVVHGRWIPTYHTYYNREGASEIADEWHCSECGIYSGNEWNYCPNCGAKMDRERKTDG